MNKKGFTLIELLVTVMVIALLSGIGIISYNSIFNAGEKKYYDTLESSVLLAGSDYFTDHRDLLPTENKYSSVEISDLIDNKYLEPIKDSKGNSCSEGEVYIYKENNNYKYEVCIRCNGRLAPGKYCNSEATNSIIATAVTKDTNQVYDVNNSYNSTAYANNENIVVTFTTNNGNIVISRYTASNNSDIRTCDATNNSCAIEFDTSGTYQIKSYDDDGNEIAKGQINVKIARTGPDFTITGNSKFRISSSQCNGNKKTNVQFEIVKANVNQEYQKIEYKMIKSGQEESSIAFSETNSLTINTALESGHYTLKVVVSNFANERQTNSVKTTTKTKQFNISYLANVEYEDGNYEGMSNTHEVVNGKAYNYISTLPTTKTAYDIDNLAIKWYKGSTLITGDTTVTDSCTHTITGKTVIPVEVKDFSTYCKTGLVYNGEEKTLTNSPPQYVTFSNNTGKIAAGTYTVKAHINSEISIWEDGTTADKNFSCTIERATVAFPTCSAKVYNGETQTLFAAHTSGKYTNSAVTGKNVGTYDTIKLTPTSNYKWKDTGKTTARAISCEIEAKNSTNSPNDYAKINCSCTSSALANLALGKAAVIATGTKCTLSVAGGGGSCNINSKGEGVTSNMGSCQFSCSPNTGYAKPSNKTCTCSN